VTDLLDEAMEALASMCYQFAYTGDGPSLCTGGLSALEEAFEALGWDDPHPIPESKCEADGCAKRQTAGTPTPNGYKRLCGDHFMVQLRRAEKDS
jgi:hypothetical protein